MLKILINAYACSPNMGSEPGMAWNWCVHLANYCELHIITEGEFRDKIDDVLPTLPQGKNLHFYYNEVTPEIRQMCWNQGDWRFYKHYKEWQYRTYQIALEIIKTNKIDIVHQLNMIGFREPGYLWKIEGIPFVWGPVDAKRKFPVAYLEDAGFKTKLFIHLKNFITALQLKFARRVRKAAKKAAFVVAASSNTVETFKTFYRIETPLINETGCKVQNNPSLDKTENIKLEVLWVGKIDFRKQLALAVKAIASSNNSNINLHVIGSGDNQLYLDLANKLGVNEQIKWHGAINHSEVQVLMQESDLLLFTSVAEGTPHVVLEAISNNLPVLCFDTCGQGDSINDTVGRKIQLSNPKQSVTDFAYQLNFLEKNRDILKELSANCKIRQQELSWDNKVTQMIELYQSSLDKLI